MKQDATMAGFIWICCVYAKARFSIHKREGAVGGGLSALKVKFQSETAPASQPGWRCFAKRRSAKSVAHAGEPRCVRPRLHLLSKLVAQTEQVRPKESDIAVHCFRSAQTHGCGLTLEARWIWQPDQNRTSELVFHAQLDQTVAAAAEDLTRIRIRQAAITYIRNRRRWRAQVEMVEGVQKIGANLHAVMFGDGYGLLHSDIPVPRTRAVDGIPL